MDLDVIGTRPPERAIPDYHVDGVTPAPEKTKECDPLHTSQFKWTLSTRAHARESVARYPHNFVSVSDYLGSIRRVGLQNN